MKSVLGRLAPAEVCGCAQSMAAGQDELRRHRKHRSGSFAYSNTASTITVFPTPNERHSEGGATRCDTRVRGLALLSARSSLWRSLRDPRRWGIAFRRASFARPGVRYLLRSRSEVVPL